MTELLNEQEFRTALEDAIKGREAKNASFSQAWANGELKREHFARWAENHYHYVGPVRRLPRLHLRQHPRLRHRRQGLPPPEHVRGGDLRRPPHRSADPLRRGVRHDPRAGDGHRQRHRRHPWSAGLVLRGLDPRALRRRHRRPGGRPRVAGAVDLPPPVPGAAREVRLRRGRRRVLRPPHHVRRDPRRARLPDRAQVRRHARRSSSAACSSCVTAPRCATRTPRRSTTPTSRRRRRSPTPSRRSPDASSISMPTIRFSTTDREVEFPDGDEVNLLRVAIRNDCGIPFKCASGNCGTDRVRVLEGAEHLMPSRNARARTAR